MRTDEQAMGADATASGSGVNRKRFLGTAAAASAAALLGACGGSQSGSGTSSATAAGRSGSMPIDAPQGLRVVFALAAIASWETPIEVGFNDAARMVGWKYERIGLPLSQYNPENVVKVINQAAVSRPDVLVTPAWVPGVYDAAVQARKMGILVLLNNANNYPDKATQFRLPYVTGDGRREGAALGTTVLQHAMQAGKKSGVILAGNTFPGNKNIEDQLAGVNEAVNQVNSQQGTSFKYVEFPTVTSDAARGVALWKDKMTQIGPSVIGLIGLGSPAAVSQQRALIEQGKRPGDIPVGATTMDATMANLLKSKWVTAVIDNNFYEQGFLPVMLAWQQKARGLEPDAGYTTGYSVVTQATLKQALDRQAKINSLASSYGIQVA